MTIDIDIDLSEQEAQAARAEALALQILGQFSAGVELLTIELGRRLGLYAALVDAGPVTRGAARRAGLDRPALRRGVARPAGRRRHRRRGRPRPARAAERVFQLPDAHAAVLLDSSSPAYLLGAAPLLLGVAETVPAVADAYATGRGVDYAEFGDELRYGIAELNRPAFTLQMRSWVEQLPDVAARLDQGGVILDAGCGEGWSSIALARAFPQARVVGVDLDPESVEVARCHVEDAGLARPGEHRPGQRRRRAALREATAGDVTARDVLPGTARHGPPGPGAQAFRRGPCRGRRRAGRRRAR